MNVSLANQIVALTASHKTVEPGILDPTDRRKIGAYLRSQVVNAQRYVLDAEMTTAATNLGLQHPEILIEMLRRARTPFPRVFIEWPLGAQLEAAGVRHEPDAPDYACAIVERMDDHDPIYRMMTPGFAFAPGIATVGLNIVSSVYSLDTEIRPVPAGRGDTDLIASVTALDPDVVRRSLVGNLYIGRFGVELDPAELAMRRRQSEFLISHAEQVFSPVVGPIIKKMLQTGSASDRSLLSRVLRSEVLEFSGQWRFVLSALAMMNSKDFIQAEPTKGAQRTRMVGGKVVPFLEHLNVKLKLPRKITERKLIKAFADSIPRRRHGVSGHYKQSRLKGDPNCNHAYVNETATRETCVICGHKRWWVNDFERGSAEIGYVTKDRLVTLT